MQQRYIYLHGFASSPSSAKAQFFKDRFHELDINLTIPDLNQHNFSELTLTRQIKQVNTILDTSDEPAILIGSSFGGLTSALIAEKNPKISKLILLAPAFKIKSIGNGFLGKENMEKWKSNGTMEIFHYGEGKPLMLKYNFAEDLELQNDSIFYQPIPTLLFHGIHDDIVPISVSREYATGKNWVNMLELDSDHSLNDKLEHIWIKTKEFI